MSSLILPKICNDVDESIYSGFNSMPAYIESTLNDDNELYKYFSIGDDPGFVENIIRDNTIKFSDPNEFNDPFECMSVIGITSRNYTKKQLEELTRNSGKKYSDDALLRAYDKIVSRSLIHYRSGLSKYGILCFSGTWDNVLMWAHYSNKCKGIIAIFQFDKYHSFYDKMMKVQYSKGISYFEIDHPKAAKKIWESFSTKDLIWKYENEYRVISPPSELHVDDGNGIKPFPRELLKGIIFGHRISLKAHDSIISIVSKYYPTLKLFDIILDDSEIKLHKVPLE